MELPILILLLLVFLVPTFLMTQREKKRANQVRAFQAQLKGGERVITVAGLHATVVQVKEETVDLEIAPGLVTTWDRRSIIRAAEDEVLPVVEEAPADSEWPENNDVAREGDSPRELPREAHPENLDPEDPHNPRP